jgi:ABC-2 type transport system ATP-binding protein
VIRESETGEVDLTVADGERAIPHILESLRVCGVSVESVSLKKPSLDDVFLKYTGVRMQEGETFTEARRTRRTFRRLTG